MALGIGGASTALIIDIIARDKASKKLLETSTHLGAVGKAISHIGLGITAVGAGVAVASVKMATDFEEAVTQLKTGAGESQKNLELVSKGLLDLSTEVGASALDLAHGMYLIESAGYHGAAGLKVLKAAAEGAKVGAADQATVADAVTSALNAYGLKANSAVKVTNQLTQTVAQGKTHMQDLAGSIGGVLAPAAALHISLAEVGGAISTMTAQGTDADRAVTSLRFLFNNLAVPTGGATKALEGLGLTSSTLSTILTHRGLNAALTTLMDAIGKKFPAGSAPATAALSKIVGGVRGMTGALELTGKHAATFVQNTKQIGAVAKKSGDTVQGFADIQKTAADKLAEAQAAMQKFAITLGEALLPALKGLLDLAQPILDWFSNLSNPVKETIVGLTILGGAVLTIAPKVLALVNGWKALKVAQAEAAVAAELAGAAETAALGPIGLIAAAIGLAAGAAFLFTRRTHQEIKPLGEVTDALHESRKAYLADVKAKYLSSVLTQKNIDLLRQSGVGYGLVKAALGGNKAALAAVDGILGSVIDKNTILNKSQHGTFKELNSTGSAIRGLKGQLDGLNGQLAADAGQWDYLRGRVSLTAGTLSHAIALSRGVRNVGPHMHGGGKAAGGDVYAGVAYTVGEQGSETFIPTMDGRIIPHGKGGGGTVNVAIYTNSGQTVIRTIQEYERANSASWRS